jgi:16S rRNA (guanine527-N7)-methyltransferase
MEGMGQTTEPTLRATLARHNIELSDQQIGLLDRYRTLLWDHNRRLNLTRHTDFDKFVGRDVLDSLQVAQLLEPGSEILDAGTGGGVPGIIVSILRPDVQVDLCESVAKKAEAVDAMVQALGLPVPVHHARAEDLLEDLRYDVVVARAVGPLWKILRWIKPHWSAVGKLLLIKGPAWVEERREARARGLLGPPLQLRRLAAYPLPGTDAEGVILGLWRSPP